MDTCSFGQPRVNIHVGFERSCFYGLAAPDLGWKSE